MPSGTVLVRCEGVDCKVIDIKFMTVCCMEGIGLLLVKGCVSIATLTPCKQ
jgi:hypothetical protein